MKLSRTCLPVILSAVLASIAEGASPSKTDLSTALRSITSDDFMKHLKVLSSDQFEGRSPASHGEELTVNYLIDEFKRIGLEPGNPDGSFAQKVPLMGVKSDFDARITLQGAPFEVSQPGEFVFSCLRFEPFVTVTNSPLIFVGYGVVAPEYGWDDFKGSGRGHHCA